MPDVITTYRTEYPDCIEIGTPGKGGALKIYFNADDLTGAQKRIDNAVNARAHLIQKLSENGAVKPPGV